MSLAKQKEIVKHHLHTADIDIVKDDGRSWDMAVQDDRFFPEVLSQGSFGLGESYMKGWWKESGNLDEFFYHILKADLDSQVVNARVVVEGAKAWTINRAKREPFEIGMRHYDIGNDLYQSMLDSRMAYTCCYWEEDIDTLESAQEAKLRLTCEKLGLKEGMRVLDIGCGWGSFLKYAAQNYGISGVGVTVSKEQVELGNQMCNGLPINILLKDYRDVCETFDRVVSLGMFEHVGWKNFRIYMKTVRKCLKDSGVFLLHTIGNNRSVRGSDRWINKYIFPNSMIPSAAQITKAYEGVFNMRDWHNFGGAMYDKTLMAWYDNFKNAWDSLKSQYERMGDGGETFYRMWKYYLLSCAGAFRADKLQLWQILLSPKGATTGYKIVR